MADPGHIPKEHGYPVFLGEIAAALPRRPEPAAWELLRNGSAFSHFWRSLEGTEGNMHAVKRSSSQPRPADDTPSEHSRVQHKIRPRTLAAEQLEYHLFVPQRAHDPLLEDAYRVWRDVWRDTFEELEGTAQIHSDEFTRQDEIGVLTLGGRCISVTGLRWLDLSLARSRDDSYFKPWPAESLAALGTGVVGITGNAVVHPDWRGTLVEPSRSTPGNPARLAFIAIALTIQRFFASPAECSVALTRNDRGMDRVAVALGATSLSHIRLHGLETNVVRFPRNCVRQTEPVVDELWGRRRQG
jgi:hypothetical protein